jgi:hypothetical protein
MTDRPADEHLSPGHAAGLTRRSVMKRLGLAAVAASAGTMDLGTGAAGAQPVSSASTVNAAGAEQTVRWTSAKPWVELTLDEPLCHLTLPAPEAGTAAELELIIRQDASGNRKVSWPGNVNSAGAIPALSRTPNAFDQFTLYSSDGVTWSLAGTAGGPPGSIDPMALAEGIVLVEARAQPLEAGSTIAASGADFTQVLDRTPNGRHLIAQNQVKSTVRAQAAPASPWFGPLQPGETGYPRIDVGVGAVLSTADLRPLDDYLLFYLLWQHPSPEGHLAFNYLRLSTATNTQLWSAVGGNSFWHDDDGYHVYRTDPGATSDYSSIPLLGIITVGAKSPGGADRVYHRINGIEQHFVKAPAAPKRLTGITIGCPPDSNSTPLELDVLALGVISPCPTLPDIRRVEQWLAGLGGIVISSS